MTRRDFITGSAMTASLAAFPSIVKSGIGAYHQHYVVDDEPCPYTASDYVQDGLMTQIDAIENVNYGERDDTSSKWYDLKTGIYIALPEEHYWGEDYLVLGKSGRFSSTSLPYSLSHFYDQGVMDMFIVCEPDLSLDDYTFEMGFNVWSGGFARLNKTWNIPWFWNCIVTNSGASPAGNLFQNADTHSVIECIAISDESNKPYGYTIINGTIRREWDGSINAQNWLYTVARGQTGYAKLMCSGLNAKLKSMLVYDRMLSDKERAWNLKVNKARFKI